MSVVDAASWDLPDTPLCRAALEIAQQFCSPALLNHSARSYAWGAVLAAEHGFVFDRELLCVSALLHDAGLTEAFDNVSTPFEDVGGYVAWVLGAGAQWPPEKRRRAAEVIARHMWPSVDPAMDSEGYLLERATSFDISGADAVLYPKDLCRNVLRRYPRLDLADDFARRFVDQANRKPQCSAARSVAAGVVDMLATNPLDSL